jgi:IPT/TIG domain
MFRTPTTRGRAVRLGVAAAVAASASIVLFQGVSGAAAGTYTASPATGPAASAGYVITLTGTGFADAAGASLVDSTAGFVGVQFASACGSNRAATTSGTAAAAFNVVSATRLAVTAPALTIAPSTATSTAFKVCVFAKTTFNLLGSAIYTIYPKPTVTKVAPAAGPTYGGNTVAVVGVNFTTRSTATVGGLPLTNIKVIGTTGLTGTAPAHAATAAALDVVVTTEAGPSVVTTAITDNDYDYRAAINVSPAVGPAAGGTILTIKGSGFNALDFTAAGTAAAVVLFVSGVYVPVTPAVAPACTGVQVISDTELVCTTPLAAAVAPLVSQAYTVTVVSDTTGGVPVLQTVLSAGSTFTAAAF